MTQHSHYRRLAAELEKDITLPPNMRLQLLFPFEWHALDVVVAGRWKNSDGTPDYITTSSNKRIDIDHLDVMSEVQQRDYIIHSAYYMAQELWEHELHEWFRVKGVPYVDPHPNGPTSFR